MARFLSRTLIRESQSVGRELSPSSHCLGYVGPGVVVRPLPWRFVGVRLRSDRPEVGQLIEVELGQGTDSTNVEVEVLSLRRLEDAIQVLVIQKSAPAWIPFVPGSSYWVPPRPRGHGFELGVIARSEKSLTEEEALSRTTRRGWPSSSYFVDGVLPDHHSTKIFSMAVAGSAAQSDEEE
ncbi:uncharacterized protein LOC110031209 [Phalaenopsis equestris]|uniref:uncharacterized protein LOC110031209 n=1 Tax=Phalaenopsis equestris TaxID=78828 RepID=UPI0009E213B9|nr:uncharacterized protein LOC110031209 [Phalaenopsis equestris]